MVLDLQGFGRKVRQYREQLGLSHGEVSEATGISEERLASLENGERSPSGDEVLILADFYKCDYKFFLSNEKLAPFEQTDILFRRFGNDFSRNDRRTVQEFLFLAEVESYLQDELGRKPEKLFVFKKVGSYFKGHGEQAAPALRSFLGYSNNEIPRDIYKDFRSVGIHVFRRRLDNSNISGLCIKHPVAGECTLINYSEDVYRQRFTAAHEAAHAILDTEEEVVVSFAGRRDLSELRANTFASQYLMPPSFLQRLPDPRRWSDGDAVRWANELRVSTDALAIALSEAGLIDRGTQERIKSVRVPRETKKDPELPDTLSPGERTRKEELLKRGLSSYYVGLCFDAYREGIISAARLTEVLLLDGDTELQELAKLYGEPLQYGD